MKIEIDTEETIYTVAVCLTGWGRGKTLHEALRNLKSASRGFVDKDYGTTLYPDGKKKKYDFTESVENQHIRLWITNDDSVTTEFFTLKPSTGKWAIYLGDCCNNARAYINTNVDDEY